MMKSFYLIAVRCSDRCLRASRWRHCVGVDQIAKSKNEIISISRKTTHETLIRCWPDWSATCTARSSIPSCIWH